MTDTIESLLAELAQAREERDALRADIEWIERWFFERKWSGTLGEPSYWEMAGPYRHTLKVMRGETLRAAIDAARTEKISNLRHVCGERGYNGMIDQACPACEQSRARAQEQSR